MQIIFSIDNLKEHAYNKNNQCTYELFFPIFSGTYI